MLAAVFVLLLLICEILILNFYDGKYLSKDIWPFNWKINAVFAFLTTFIEAAMMFYVGACIGQLRWQWSKKKEHRLRWLDVMSNAREPSGVCVFFVISLCAS